ncbi:MULTISPECIES: co-chaperone GroES [unclassified Oribacterium]|jgi:chaperonin GroES|uniref:co-chaperone GroES n=1 Tax=unclassified Oribacterium TaxID=2629782 RepID=UPI000410BB1F|nr:MULTISPECIES: co-chaperone GroES [unclassified Oribacterium]MBO5598521.1 co-chaperone GroES [Oribacterium sp.]MBP3804936.1 co-chaperone GroES [Oribacterium sp.]MBR1856690.1 co-chaperone GroES [Oribacterium sp.]MCR5007570.1 co-chaperone GroES [Oribacterium sp.]SEA51652.1 chaperonin GroES [Oribacterium sp. KHPX15]
MKLVPLFDRVVLEKEKMEETTASGIVLPGQNDKEKPGQAVVVAVGPGGVVDGKEITMQVKVGDHVLFSKYAGSEVEIDGTKYTVVKQNDILAVVEK